MGFGSFMFTLRIYKKTVSMKALPNATFQIWNTAVQEAATNVIQIWLCVPTFEFVLTKRTFIMPQAMERRLHKKMKMCAQSLWK